MTNSAQTAIFYGVGVGTGDPELLTIKALRTIQSCSVIAYVVNDQGQSQARNIAKLALEPKDSEQIEIPIPMPMLLDRTLANASYDQAANNIRKYLDTGHDVAFLCEGDPLFFGSFAYLLERLQTQYTCRSIAGITSLQAASSALCQPLTCLNDSLAVVTGRHSDEHIHNVLTTHDSVVIMKVGKSRQRLIKLIKAAGRSNDTHYLEYIGREKEYIMEDIEQLPDTEGVYFSVFIIKRSS